MKRRETKKNIRKEVSYLTKTAWEYLESPASRRDTGSNAPLLSLCSSLTVLLAEHLRIYSTWNSRERWLDGIEDPTVQLISGTLEITGQMTWGLRSNIGGEQWEEPFTAVVQFSGNQRRLICYTLSFGKAGELYQSESKGRPRRDAAN